MRRYVICDIEATGLDEDKEPIEIALITFEDGKVTDVYESLINPLRPVSEFIQDLTSISGRELETAPKFYEIAESVRLRLEGSVFVSHNTDFDLELLKKKFEELGQELLVKKFCTLKVAQHEIPGLKNYNLDALCSFFGIKIQERHRAIGDARATLDLFKELLQLRHRDRPRLMWLPHHEKFLRDVPAKAGLLQFKNKDGKVVRSEACFNMQKRARELLLIKAENRDLLTRTEDLAMEPTGSALIAEFKKLLLRPYRPNWMIVLQETKFMIRPYKKGIPGLWYFHQHKEARQKLRGLQAALKGQTYAYREGGKTKEELLQEKRKVELLSKDARFPSENLVLVGEGRTAGERSVVLVRDGHVLGYGHTEAPEEDIFASPERHLTSRFCKHLGADLAARNYLRVLKNLRQKNEGWRSLSGNDKKYA